MKKSTKIGLILVNFKICFCVKLKYYYQKFILERWLATCIVSTQFEFFQMLSCLLRFWVWNHLFDKRFCRISAIMQPLPEFFFCLGVFWFGNVMACTLSSKMGEKMLPLFCQNSSQLMSANCSTSAFSLCTPTSLKNSDFSVKPQNIKIKSN